MAMLHTFLLQMYNSGEPPAV